jgi:hypothetical protein
MKPSARKMLGSENGARSITPEASAATVNTAARITNHKAT